MKKLITIMAVLVVIKYSASSRDFEKKAPAGFDTPRTDIPHDGTTGNYLPLANRQDDEGLTISLLERTFEEMAYVIKLTFIKKIPALLSVQK